MGLTKSERARRELVRQLEDGGRIRSAPVRDAFLAVPREIFIPEFASKNRIEDVYKPNEAIPTRFDRDGMSISSSSAPTIMAIMLEQLDLQPDQRVLEIGTGTGYNAALIKHIVGPRGRVTSIDIDGRNTREARAHLKSAGARVRLVTGDGRRGVSKDAPFDRIAATVSSVDIPRSWFRQLRSGGRINLPLQLTTTVDHPQVAVAFEKAGRMLRSVEVTAAGFMGMRNAESSPAAFVRHVMVRMSGGDGDDRVIALLSGEVLKTFDQTQLARFIGLVFGDGRTKKLRMELREYFAFVTFLALNSPSERLVMTSGLTDPKARSLAYITVDRSGVKLRSAGGVWAERAMLRHFETWKRRGRPSVGQLRIEATFSDDVTPRGKTSARGDCTLGFTWAKADS